MNNDFEPKSSEYWNNITDWYDAEKGGDKARQLCFVGNSLREKRNLIKRQPLNALYIVGEKLPKGPWLEHVKEELNVKQIILIPNQDLKFSVKIDFKKLGPVIGPKMKEVTKELKNGNFVTNDGVLTVAGINITDFTKHLVYDDSKVGCFDDCAVFYDEVITKELQEEEESNLLISTINKKRKDLGMSVSDLIVIRTPFHSAFKDKILIGANAVSIKQDVRIKIRKARKGEKFFSFFYDLMFLK